MMILRMISTGSLSAFSASIAQSRLGQTWPVQGVRALSPEPKAGPLPQMPAPPPGSQAAPAGNRILPRGSLLDLTV